MMSDLSSLAAGGALALAALLLAAHFALKAWHAWIDYKKLELASGGARHDPPVTGVTGGRIELADLKERVRKLEAIASGIDL